VSAKAKQSDRCSFVELGGPVLERSRLNLVSKAEATERLHNHGSQELRKPGT